jgi:hypothetical protein
VETQISSLASSHQPPAPFAHPSGGILPRDPLGVFAVRNLFLAVAAFVALSGSTALAQYGGPGYHYGGGYGGYGWGGGGYGGGTAAGNAMQGMASVIQAQGVNHLLNSEAAKNYEDARSKYFDNRIKGTQTYFELRRMNRAYTDAERDKPMTSEAAFRYAHEDAPKRISNKQIDPITGSIHWPTILNDPEYSDDRNLLNAVFAQRERKHGSLTQEEYSEIQKTTGTILTNLKKNVKKYAPDDYLAAKKFTESLAYEARFLAH